MAKAKTFRVRIAARRQVTMPPEVLTCLDLQEGDTLEIEVQNGSFKGRGLKLIPADFFTEHVLDLLRRREDEIDEVGIIEVQGPAEAAMIESAIATGTKENKDKKDRAA